MESAKVYLLNRNQLERSPLMTAPMTASRPKLLDQVSRGYPHAPLHPEDRGNLCSLDQAVHPFPQQTPSRMCNSLVTVSDLPKSTNFDIRALCPDIPEFMHKDCSIT